MTVDMSESEPAGGCLCARSLGETCALCRAEITRRYDGSTEHADWCDDHDHQGMCLDVFLAGVDARAAVERLEAELEVTRKAHGCTDACVHRGGHSGSDAP